MRIRVIAAVLLSISFVGLSAGSASADGSGVVDTVKSLLTVFPSE